MTKPIEISAEEVKRAGGDVGAAVRIREASEKRHTRVNHPNQDTVVLRVIGKPPSINKLLGGKLKDRISNKAWYAEVCVEAWRRAGKPIVQSPFKLACRMVLSGTEFDPSNLYQGAVKVFLDAMQSIGCIEQDNWKAHRGPDKYSWCNATHDLVEFTLTTVATKRKF